MQQAGLLSIYQISAHDWPGMTGSLFADPASYTVQLLQLLYLRHGYQGKNIGFQVSKFCAGGP